MRAPPFDFFLYPLVIFSILVLWISARWSCRITAGTAAHVGGSASYPKRATLRTQCPLRRLCRNAVPAGPRPSGYSDERGGARLSDN